MVKRIILVVVMVAAAAVFLLDATHESASRSAPGPAIYQEEYHSFVTTDLRPSREVDAEGDERIDHGRGW